MTYSDQEGFHISILYCFYSYDTTNNNYDKATIT